MAYFLRPVAYPVRQTVAHSFCARPSYPSINDFASLFSLFDESLAHLERAQRQSRQHFKRPFNPKFDVKEANGAYSLEGELPGFDAKDLSIEFLDDGHTLQIKGRTVQERQSGQQSQPAKTVEGVEASKAVEAKSEGESEAGSVRSHKATVEDDIEEPANASAAAEQPVQPEQTVAETQKPIEQQRQPEQPETKHLVSERYTGSFSRSFKFPSKVDQEAVKASLKDGILAITLPFARKPESRRIQIE